MSEGQSSQTNQNNAKRAVLEMIVSGMLTQMLHVAAKLGLADLVKDGSKTSAELAELTQSHPGALYRLLRALASVGVFQEDESRRFSLTPMADCLRTDSPDSVRSYAIWAGTKCWWQPWGSLMHSVKTGKTAFKEVFGMEIFEYFGQDEELAGIFNQFMNERILPFSESVVAAYDFSSAGKIIDVGGGQGRLVATILKANPGLEAVVFDLPAVVAGAGAILESEKVAERVEVVGGSFFESVPEGGDIYILSAIIHDWDDETCEVILGNCREAMKPGSKLLVIDAVIKPGNERQFGKLTDLNMLVLAGGQERTEAEFEALLSSSGFKVSRVISTDCPASIIEAVVV